MKVLGADILVKAQRTHAAARARLSAWKAEVDAACWRSFKDVKESFPATDMVKKRLVFDIGGNKYRLIAGVDFEAGIVRIRWFGTHAEYNKIEVNEV
jgi:mRNA interferase HigB